MGSSIDNSPTTFAEMDFKGGLVERANVDIWILLQHSLNRIADCMFVDLNGSKIFRSRWIVIAAWMCSGSTIILVAKAYRVHEKNVKATS